jgi:transposase-like protein
MPLSARLLPVRMTYCCPTCETQIVKTGGWLQTIKRFGCQNCGTEIHLSHTAKLELFEKHAGPAS